ncbi:unnamed protein product, partial [Notodromas monacha]
MAGVLAGCVVYGHLSDRIGRRAVILLGTVQLISSSLLTTFTESMTLFILLRFLVAMGTNAQFTVAFVLVMEIIGGRKRTVMGIAYEYPFSLGFMTLPGIAYLISDWRYLQLAISLPIVFLLVYY